MDNTGDSSMDKNIDSYPAPDESRVDWGNPSDPKFPAKIKAWDEGYALGMKRRDAEVAALQKERDKWRDAWFAMREVANEFSDERAALRAERKGTLDKHGKMHPSWHDQPREKLLDALEFQGAMTNVLDEKVERMRPVVEAIDACPEDDLPPVVVAAFEAFRAAQQETTDAYRCHVCGTDDPLAHDGSKHDRMAEQS